MSKGPCKIPLTKGKVALVSPQDWPIVMEHKWRAIPSGLSWYAATNMPRTDGNSSQATYQTVLLHRFIMGAPKGCRVKHLDCDSLNCQRMNLRVISRLGMDGYKVVHYIDGQKENDQTSNLWKTTYSRHLGAHESLQDIGHKLVQAGLIKFSRKKGMYVPSKLLLETIDESYETER